jgi:ubiquinone/menaquinone biosynthesis C-methylase UbiE
MRNHISPLIAMFPESKWLTVGDGDFGSDAYFLEQKGVNVTASSISTETISISHKKGYIKKFKAINAENIAEDDNSYDFVYCKEAYHHFPRPPIAFYEMFRVGKKAVILIEPQDTRISLLNSIKKLVKLTLRGDSSFEFETTGNYIFRVNIREIKKMMTSLNQSVIAYKKFNDFFHKSLAGKVSKGFSPAKLISLFGIKSQDLLCKLGLLDYGLTVIIIFKGEVDQEKLKTLKKEGYKVSKLPVNPFI